MVVAIPDRDSRSRDSAEPEAGPLVEDEEVGVGVTMVRRRGVYPRG